MSSTTSCGSIKWSNRQLGIMSTTDSDAKTTPVAGPINGFTVNDVAAAAASGEQATERYHFDCGSTGQQAFGIQSMGYDANFDLSPVFEFCDSEPYFINEGLPQVEITVNKILDGSCPVYLMASKDAPNPTLFGRSACKSHIASAIFPCEQSATGQGLGDDASTPRAIVLFKDTQVNSISYTFGTDGSPFQEDVTFLGNDVIWVNPSATNDTPDNIDDIADCSGELGFGYTNAFISDAASIKFDSCCSGVHGPTLPSGQARKPQYREDFIWDVDPDAAPVEYDANNALVDPDITVLPQVIAGIDCDGTNKDEEVAIQSLTISVDLNREELNALGRRGPKTRTITPPLTVNTSIEIASEYDSGLSAVEDGTFTPGNQAGTFCAGVGDNLRAGTIRVAICGGLRLYTGIQNKIQSITVGGGSTDGDNQTVTYNFQTFNTLTVMHENDCADLATTWWAARKTWLADAV